MFPVFPMVRTLTILASQTMGVFYFKTFQSLQLTNIVFYPREFWSSYNYLQYEREDSLYFEMFIQIPQIMLTIELTIFNNV